MGVLTELKPLSASAKNNKTDGGHIVAPSSPTAAANINNNFRSSQFECQQQKKPILTNTNIHIKHSTNFESPFLDKSIHSPTNRALYEYETDHFQPPQNTITMSDNTKNICPSKIPPIPISQNIGSFPSPLQGHPNALPMQSYPAHWSPASAQGPGYPPSTIPYGEPSNFMPPPFPNDPNIYRNHSNHSTPPHIPPRNSPHIPLPHHLNGGTPPLNTSSFSPSSAVTSKFPSLPPGCSSPPPNSQGSLGWSLPSSDPQSNNPNGENISTKDNFEPLNASNITGDNCLSTVSPNSNKGYGGSMYPNAGEEHSERIGGGHASSKGNSVSSTHPTSPPILCAGCKLRIMDKFVLEVVDAKWHSTCLKCVECGVVLENHMACFEKDRQFFCKEDYFRMYAHEQDRQRQCSRCLLDIQPTDLVMKDQTHHSLFHVDCFRCARCDAVLKKGDFYGMFDGMPYCQSHYELLTSGHSEASGIHPPSHSGGTFSSESLNHSPVEGLPLPSTSGGEHDGFSPQGPVPGGMGYPPYPLHGPEQPPPPGWYPGPPGEGPYPGTEYPYENNNTSGMLKKRRGRKKRKVDSAFAASMGGYMDPSMGGYPPHPGMDGSQMDHGKSKRARTSFKHHQLRIMRSHFQINQNPDSRELKMLSQKTGLDKKVLQVWFQNSRAKYRRGITQPGTGGSCESNVSASAVGIPSQTHHTHSSNEAATGVGHDDKAGSSTNTLNSMMSNDETDSDSLMEGMPVQ